MPGAKSKEGDVLLKPRIEGEFTLLLWKGGKIRFVNAGGAIHEVEGLRDEPSPNSHFNFLKPLHRRE